MDNDNKTVDMRIRTTESDKQMTKDLAKDEGMSLSQYIRYLVLQDKKKKDISR